MEEQAARRSRTSKKYLDITASIRANLVVPPAGRTRRLERFGEGLGYLIILIPRESGGVIERSGKTGVKLTENKPGNDERHW